MAVNLMTDCDDRPQLIRNFVFFSQNVSERKKKKQHNSSALKATSKKQVRVHGLLQACGHGLQWKSVPIACETPHPSYDSSLIWISNVFPDLRMGLDGVLAFQGQVLEPSVVSPEPAGL